MKRDDMRASRGARTDESEEGAVPVSSSDDIRVHAVVAGLVQGVGFRYFTVMTAGKLGLGGWVRNCYDGSVEVEAQGVISSFRSLPLSKKSRAVIILVRLAM